MANASLQAKEHRGDGSNPEVTRGVSFSPRVDIVETAEELTVFADLPGVKSNDVDVRFENGELTLRGRCDPRHQGGFLMNEYHVGDFYRVFTVSEAINAEKISAELKGGVLTIHLPKAEAVKPRRIAVKGE
jgi:HSP20 family molecular chaperone IbpA